MKCPFGHLGPAVPAVFLLYILCVPSPLAEVAAWETEDPDTVPVLLSNGWCVTSTGLVTNPKHCTLEAVRRQFHFYLCCKISHQGRRLAWLNTDLRLELVAKKESIASLEG